jgi:hypothetical protein
MNGSTRILLKPVECTYKVVFYRKILKLMPPFTGTGLAAAATPVLSHSAFLSEHQKPRFTRIKRSNTSTIDASMLIAWRIMETFDEHHYEGAGLRKEPDVAAAT